MQSGFYLERGIKRNGSERMIIRKVLNNSTVMVCDENQTEHIVFGKGIAFGKSKGDSIEVSSISKKFTLHDSKGEQLYHLIERIPENCFQISQEIIEYTEAQLKKSLNDSIYFTLTDHIAFIIERYKQGFLPANPLKWEIQRYYKAEYKIAGKAVELINDEFDIQLNEDETASIAMHIVNAELDMHLHESMEMIELMNGIMQIIHYHIEFIQDENDLNYQRLITHLKFFVQRIINRKQHEADNILFDIVTKNYPKAYEITEKIQIYITKKTNYVISKDELTYLTIHLQRLLERS